MTDTVLCVDIGTTSLKAGLITASGEVVSVSSYKYLSQNNRYVASRWIEGLKNAFEKTCRQFSGDVRIVALSISGNGPTVVCDGGLTSLWNEQTGIARERTMPSLFLPNILFLKENFPEDFAKSKYVFSGPEYLIYELTGNAVTILPEKRFIPAYWNEQILTREGISFEKMPPFVGLGQCYGYVTADKMKELGLDKFWAGNVVGTWEELGTSGGISTSGKIGTGGELGTGGAGTYCCGDMNSSTGLGTSGGVLPAGLPVFGAGPDFVAALIGTGTLQSGRICDRSGSSEGFNFCVPSYVECEGVRTLPSVIPDLWNVSVLIPTSSKIEEEKRLELIKNAVEHLKELAAKNGFDFPKEITVTGGQTRDSAYMKKKACVLGVDLVVCRCSDSELLGDACVAWYGLGKYSSLQEAAENIVKKGRVYESV